MKNSGSYVIKLFAIFYAPITLERERERERERFYLCKQLPSLTIFVTAH